MADVLTAPPPAPDHVIPYGSEPSQFGHLRLPERAPVETENRVPVVVVVHGGFWRVRYSLDHIGHLCAALTAQGWATWSLEYRRLGEPGGGWPGTFLDAGRGLDHVRALAGAYPLDLSRVVVIGHSAGGHLALWLAGRHRLTATSEVYTPGSLPVRGAVSLAGVNDLRMAVALGLSNTVAVELMGGVPDDVPWRYAAGNPAELVPLGCPSILVHGAADEIVPSAISNSFAVHAAAAGDRAKLALLPDAGHFEVIDPRSNAWRGVRGAVAELLTG